MNDYLVYTTSEEPDPGAEAVLYTVANGSRDVESVAGRASDGTGMGLSQQLIKVSIVDE